MKQKTYIFHVSRGDNKHERFELREEQLERHHRKMLLGQLRQVWENTPEEQQKEFLHEMAKEAAERMAKRIFSEFDKREELDDRIDNIIKEWKRNKSGNERLWSMIESLEKDYDYVGVTVYPGSKLVVKIHDGIQEFN